MIWIADDTDESAANVSMTRDGSGHLWFALEEYGAISNPTDPALRLIWYDVSAPAFNLKTLQTNGQLSGAAIYPSIAYWPTTDEIIVAGKLDDPLWNAPHLQMYAQDASSFLTGFSSESVTPSGSLEHSVPCLARENDTPSLHLSWTAKNNLGTEDVKTKVKDGPSWLGSTLRTVSDTGDKEDHAQFDFTYSGRRITVYHRDQAIATDPDIWIKINTWDGTTWTDVADFGLTSSSNLDFPAIFVRNSGGTTAEIAVVARSPFGNIALWRCGPAADSSCDSAAEFGSPQVTTVGTNWKSPQVIVVPRSTTTDTLVFVEDSNNNQAVHLLSLCGGSGNAFVDEGGLPLAPGYNVTDSQYLGYIQSWARRQVGFDGTDMHLSFLQEKPGKSTLNVMHYHVAPGDICP